MESLKIENLNFSYKSCPNVFSDLSCKICNAPFIHVNGISGSGKTTLFKIFAGFISASFNNLVISDLKILNDSNPFDRNIAMVFQKSSLWQHLSVKKNIKLAWNKNAIPLISIQQWMDYLGISAFENKNCSKLSAGEQQRVEIIRALASGKKNLLLDEPFAFQDKSNLGKLIEIVESFREITQGTVLFSTHSSDSKNYFSSQSSLTI